MSLPIRLLVPLVLTSLAFAQNPPLDDDPIPLPPVPPPNACENLPGDPLLHGVANYIPITTNKGFYVVYSGRLDQPGGSVVTNNVGIFIVPLKKLTPTGNRRALIFGSGYGGGPINVNSAFDDAALTAEILEDHMNRLPGNTDLVVAVPHGHFDHINPDFVLALQALNYTIEGIHFHADDAALVNTCGSQYGCGFAQEYLTNGYTTISQMNFGAIPLVSFTGSSLGGTLFQSNLGTLTFDVVPGHTCGTLDLRIDWAEGELSNRVYVRGAMCNVNQPPGGVPGITVVHDIPPHENVELRQTGLCASF